MGRNSPSRMRLEQCKSEVFVFDKKKFPDLNTYESMNSANTLESSLEIQNEKYWNIEINRIEGRGMLMNLWEKTWCEKKNLCCILTSMT